MTKLAAFGCSVGFKDDSGTVLETQRDLVTHVHGGPVGLPDSHGQRDLVITSSTGVQQSFWYRRPEGKEIEVHLPAGSEASLRAGHQVTQVWATVTNKNGKHVKDLSVAVVNHTTGVTSYLYRNFAYSINAPELWRFMKGTALWLAVIVASVYLLPVVLPKETAHSVTMNLVLFGTPAYIAWRWWGMVSKDRRVNKEFGEALRQHIAGIRV